MANRTIFSSTIKTPPADTFNDAGGKAYSLSHEQALAQLALTGTVNDTFYADAEMQVQRILEAAKHCSVKYIAQVAMYARQNGYMKDLPALLVAYLTTRLAEDNGHAFRLAFARVIDNGKMLRNFVQIVRSGVVGRKSLGTFPRNTVRWWLDTRTDEQLFRDSVGNDPSLADIIKMVHPKPRGSMREQMYGYLLGKIKWEDWKGTPPICVTEWEQFKQGGHGYVPDVDFRLLASVCSDPVVWGEIARNARWQMTRMNLNTFARHGVFESEELTNLIAERLRDPDEVRKSRCFPYQLLTAYYQTEGNVPPVITDALKAAMEVALENTPVLPGKTAVCLDVSGSMSGSITGYRKGATSLVRCVDVAALYAAALAKRNPQNTAVIPFDTRVYQMTINGAMPSVMTIAARLAQFGGGGTNCHLAMKAIREGSWRPDNVIYISDNQSWADRIGWGQSSTGLSNEWTLYKKKVPDAKMVCIDLTANTTSQAPNRRDTLNCGGFSDNVFDLVADFCGGRTNSDYLVNQIKQVSLND